MAQATESEDALMIPALITLVFLGVPVALLIKRKAIANLQHKTRFFTIVGAAWVATLVALGSFVPTPQEENAATGNARDKPTTAAPKPPASRKSEPPPKPELPPVPEPDGVNELLPAPAPELSPLPEGDTLAPAPIPPPVNEAPLLEPGVEVAEVVDGDTLELVDGRRVRVLGIDTPERGEPCYAEATDHLTSLVGSGPVFLVGDPTQRDVDRYGRLLRYVDTSQGDASEQQAREGLARYYDVGKPVERAPQIQAAETEAQAAQRGIWSATPCAPVPEPAPTPEPVPPPAEPVPVPPPAEPVPVPEDSGTYYPNCAAVREAGAAPLYAGDPGYSGDLDSDGDGVACE